MVNNARAGIAVENGFGFQVRNNLFQDNDHGVLLWSKYISDFLDVVPLNDSSYNWSIEDNSFIHNNKAVRIAANQDHGIHPYKVPEGKDPQTWFRPHDHFVRRNTLKRNRIGVESEFTDRTVLEANVFEDNLESDHIELI